MSRPAFIWSPAYEINIGRHVFPTQKFRLLRDKLIADGLLDADEIEAPQPASREELLAVLTREYLDDLLSCRHTRRTLRSELPISKQIIDGCIATAGGSVLCARRALERGAACHLGGGFHHGFADHAEGFCYINDVAVAAAAVRREGLCRRVSIIDTDVHQGNGTASIFKGEPEVFTFSIHQERLYPEKEESDLDIGLEDAIGDEGYLAGLQGGVAKAIGEFAPELVIYVAGADPYKEDQLGNLGLSWDGMRRRDQLVLGAAAERGIPFMTVVAGGYSRDVNDTVGLHAATVEMAIAAALKLPDRAPAQ